MTSRWGWVRHPASLRYPSSVWGYRTSALVVALLLAPLVGTMVLAPDLRTFDGVVTTTQLIVFPASIGAAVLLHVHYRLTGSNVLAWATLCLTLYAVHGLLLAGLRAGDRESFFDRQGWVLVIDLPVAAFILVAIRTASRVPLSVDPLSTGLLSSLLVSAVNLTVYSQGPDLTMSRPVVTASEVLLAAIGAGIAHAAYRLEEIPRWCAARLGLGTLGLVANRLASCQDTTNGIVNSVAVVTGLLGAVLMVSAAGASLRFALQEQRSSLATLASLVAAMEADGRDGRARLHEITNSIASIAAASSLLRQQEVPPVQRQRVVQMLAVESGRLSRLLTSADSDGTAVAGTAPGGTADTSRLIHLDEVIGALVTSQQVLRRPVEWKPTGHVAVGDADAVAEVVNILLDNSAKHAPESRTSIEVSHQGDVIEIAVHDDGPGIPAEVRPRIYEWGSRGQESAGQGIGLHLASQLMTARGNSIRLEPNSTGTTFVVRLPAAVKERT
jgi:signal transduction histidine kinase